MLLNLIRHSVDDDMKTNNVIQNRTTSRTRLKILSSMSVDDVDDFHHRFLISTDSYVGDGFRMLLYCGQGPASVCRRCFGCPGRISDKPG